MWIHMEKYLNRAFVCLFVISLFSDQFVAIAYNGRQSKTSSRTSAKKTGSRYTSLTSRHSNGNKFVLTAGGNDVGTGDVGNHANEDNNNSNINNKNSNYDKKKAKKKKKKKDSKKGSSAAKSRPHVIIIIADDLGYNDVSYHGKYGRSLIKTPHIDRLAYSGVRLENYYVQPVCTPTRSQLVTGRYQIHTGMQHINLFPGRASCLPLDETTIAQAMKKLGYSTHAVGKWHLGYAWKDCLPRRRGFDSFFGNIMGSANHWSHNKTARLNGKELVTGKAMYVNERVYWKHEDTFSTVLYTNRARQLIRNQPRNKPLFLYLSFEAVHTPLTAPESYSEPYANTIKNHKRRKYAGLVSIMDEAVNNITEALKYNGLYDNSVIIFTTDNGGRPKPRSVGNNWPLRGGKSTMWEGGIRGVGFVHSPLIPYDARGSVNYELIHVSDWFPTIVKGIAGGRVATRKPLDGVNQWKTITMGTASKRKEILHNINPVYKPALWTKSNERHFGKLSDLPFNATISAGIRVGSWKLLTGLPHEDYWEPPMETGMPREKNDVRWSTPIRLYNIQRDPNERQNVARYYKSVVFRLLKRLHHYQSTAVEPLRMGAKDMRGSPIYNGGAWRPWMD